MHAKLVFLVAAAAGAVSFAALGGLIAAAAGLCAGMPREAVVTLAAGTAAAVFGGGVALADIAAGLFLSGNRAIPTTRRPGAMRAPGVPGSRSADTRLRDAVEARALILHAGQAEARAPGRRQVRDVELR